MVELTWEGKYDENGKRTAPLRLQLPFQTVETVNESAQERQIEATDGQIDGLVYELYGLTEEEIGVVEGRNH